MAINEDDFLNYHEKIVKNINALSRKKYFTVDRLLYFLDLYKFGVMKLFEEGSLKMDIRLIIDGKATLEDLVELYEKKGVSFVIEDGHVTEVIF